MVGRKITEQFPLDEDTKRDVLEQRNKNKELEENQKQNQEQSTHYSKWIGKHRQFLKNPPNAFHFRGLDNIYLNLIHNDEYYICYKAISQVSENGPVIIRLVYLFKQKSFISEQICGECKSNDNLRIVSTYLQAKDLDYPDWPLEPFSAIGFNIDETF